MKKALLALGVVLALGLGGEVVARVVVNRAMSETLRVNAASEGASASVGGSVVVGLLTGRFASVHVDVDDATRNGFTVDRVVADLTDVRFSRGVFLGRRGDVSAGGGTAEVTITEDAVNDFFGETGLSVSFADGITGTFRTARFGEVSVRVSLQSQGGRLVLVPESLSGGGLRVPLPRVMPGLPLAFLPASTTVVDSAAAGGSLTVDLGFGPFTVPEGR